MSSSEHRKHGKEPEPFQQEAKGSLKVWALQQQYRAGPAFKKNLF